jgi:hypothetical protein
MESFLLLFQKVDYLFTMMSYDKTILNFNQDLSFLRKFHFFLVLLLI